MNLGRIEYNYSLIPVLREVNPFWLLGFIEAEGTFGFKNLSPFFQIGQHVRNLFVLEAIACYLNSIPKGFKFSLCPEGFRPRGIKSGAPTVNFSLNKKTSVFVISIANIDTLYDYLLFFLLDKSFQTRKGIDFHLWCLVLHLHKLGYFYLPLGLKPRGKGKKVET